MVDRARAVTVFPLAALGSVGFAAGLVAAWAVISAVWVPFGVLPMWIAGLAACTTGVVAQRKGWRALGVGLAVDCLICVAVFTLLSWSRCLTERQSSRRLAAVVAAPSQPTPRAP